jgi:hypothetical protein
MVRYLPDQWQAGLTMIGKSFALRYRRANTTLRPYDAKTQRRNHLQPTTHNQQPTSNPHSVKDSSPISGKLLYEARTLNPEPSFIFSL